MLFPPIEPYNHFLLDVDSVHKLYIEECGNPDGIPVVFIHGGPGAGCSADDRRFFDPVRYRIVLFDQRGCGRSLPLAELKDNTTNHLIADLETIREYLKIDRWVVFGGSWGSTLSLAYAQAHPDKPLALILRGVFLGTQTEIDYFSKDGCRFYPQEHQRYLNYLPQELRDNPEEGYYQLMTQGDKDSRVAAAKSYTAWPLSCVALNPDSVGLLPDENPDIALAEALLEVHYLLNRCFFSDGQLMSGLESICHIPTKIIQGRYDLLTPPITAFQVHKALPNSELTIVNTAGHYSRDPGTAEGLVKATSDIADLLAKTI